MGVGGENVRMLRILQREVGSQHVGISRIPLTWYVAKVNEFQIFCVGVRYQRIGIPGSLPRGGQGSSKGGQAGNLPTVSGGMRAFP